MTHRLTTRQRRLLAGTADTDEDDTTEEADDTTTAADGTDTSLSDLQSGADPERFDQTFLAEADDWQLGGPVPSPAPFPLQVLPRMAYTITYTYVYNESRDRWEPQKKSNTARGTLGDAGQTTLPANSTGTIDTDITEEDLAGDTLVPSMALAESGNPDARVFQWTDPGDTSVDIGFAIGWSPTRGNWFIEFNNTQSQDIDVTWAVQRITVFEGEG